MKANRFVIFRLNIRILLLAASVAAVSSLCGGAPYAYSDKPVFEINLDSYSAKINKLTGRTDHAVVLISDGTIWTIFPVHVEGLVSRGTSTAFEYGVLHLSQAGDRISQCALQVPGDSSVKDFFPRIGNGFVIRTASSLISLTSACEEKSAIPSPGPGVEATPDGLNLILEGDKELQIIDAENLKRVGSMSAPANLQHFHRAIIWNHLVLLRASAAMPCYWARWNVSSLKYPVDWHTLACPEEMMAAFGDDQVIVSNWTAPSLNVLSYKLDGSLLHSFPVPDSMRTDASMFPRDSCLSPGSERAGIFFFDRKRTWLGQEKVTGEHLEIIDLANGQNFLSLPVSDGDPLLNCSLSQDGKTLALLRGLNLSVFSLPG